MDSHRPIARAPSRWEAVRDAFPFGLAPFIILCLTVISGLFLLAVTVLGPSRAGKADLSMWTFARQHYVAYEKARPAFEKAHGVKLDLQNVHGDAVTRRLRAAHWADLDLPDAVEVEISRAGGFFRGPADGILFADITDLLMRPDPGHPQRVPLIDRIVKTRLSPYTHRGRIYGLPHDVHPVMLAYRADLFEQLGIDPNALRTWDEFVRVARRVTNRTDRYMINLAKSSSWAVEILLFQRAEPNAPAGYFDADGRLIVDNEQAVDLLTWYVPLVTGPKRIAADPGMFGQAFAKATQDGYTLCSFCPDWKTWGIQNDMPQLTGKMKLMPLPAVRPGGRRTSTWGGTMLGITRNCPDRRLAWKLARHMYL